MREDDPERARRWLQRCAGNCAGTATYSRPDGELSYRIWCRICSYDGRKWTTEDFAKNRYRKGIEGRGTGWELVMARWVLHMEIQHKQYQQPDWELPDELPAERMRQHERQYFSGLRTHAEREELETMMRAIFGDVREMRKAPSVKAEGEEGGET